MTSIIIPNTVTSIGSSAFSSCIGLTSIIIPSSVTTIGGHAFYYCTGLTSITIPSSVTSIGIYAFFDCINLISVTTGRTLYIYNSVANTKLAYIFPLMKNLTLTTDVTSIGDTTFQNCTTLTSINIPASVSSIGNDAFKNCHSLSAVNIDLTNTTVIIGPNDGVFTGCPRNFTVYTSSQNVIDYINTYYPRTPTTSPLTDLPSALTFNTSIYQSISDSYASNLEGIDLDNSGNIYITNIILNRVVKLNPDGSLNNLNFINTPRPRAILIDKDNNFIYLSYNGGPFSSMINKFDLQTGALIRTNWFSSNASVRSMFIKGNYMYIVGGSNTNARIHKINLSTRVIAYDYTNTTYVIFPMCIVVDKNDNIYIGDGQLSSLIKISTSNNTFTTVVSDISPFWMTINTEIINNIEYEYIYINDTNNYSTNGTPKYNIKKYNIGNTNCTNFYESNESYIFSSCFNNFIYLRNGVSINVLDKIAINSDGTSGTVTNLYTNIISVNSVNRVNVTSDIDGNLYIPHVYNLLIYKLTPTSNVSIININGVDGTLDNISRDLNNNIYAIINNNITQTKKLIKIDINNVTNIIATLTFDYLIYSMMCDSNGNLYILLRDDNGTTKLEKYTFATNETNQITVTTTTLDTRQIFLSDNYSSYNSLIRDSYGNMYLIVYDTNNNIKIYKIASDNSINLFIDLFTDYINIYNITSMAFDNYGNCFVSLHKSNTIWVYNINGQFITSYNMSFSVIYMTFDNNNYMYVVDNKGNYWISEAEISCFKSGSMILTENGYVNVQDLQRGDRIKTMNGEYRTLEMIGKRNIFNPASEPRIIHQLYKYSKEDYPELIEDLVITGFHARLIDEYKDDEERENAHVLIHEDDKVDNKFKLPAYVDETSSVYEEKGMHNVFHIVLENEDIRGKYGIYANGMLVESCSKFDMINYAKMTMME